MKINKKKYLKKNIIIICKQYNQINNYMYSGIKKENNLINK